MPPEERSPTESNCSVGVESWHGWEGNHESWKRHPYRHERPGKGTKLLKDRVIRTIRKAGSYTAIFNETGSNQASSPTTKKVGKGKGTGKDKGIREILLPGSYTAVFNEPITTTGSTSRSIAPSPNLHASAMSGIENGKSAPKHEKPRLAMGMDSVSVFSQNNAWEKKSEVREAEMVTRLSD
jgi:hypothetical protein